MAASPSGECSRLCCPGCARPTRAPFSIAKTGTSDLWQ
jgi:hypothetical protein